LFEQLPVWIRHRAATICESASEPVASSRVAAIACTTKQSDHALELVRILRGELDTFGFDNTFVRLALLVDLVIEEEMKKRAAGGRRR